MEKSDPTCASFPITPSTGDPEILHIPELSGMENALSRSQAPRQGAAHHEFPPGSSACCPPAPCQPCRRTPRHLLPQRPGSSGTGPQPGSACGHPPNPPRQPRSVAVPTGNTTGLRGGNPAPQPPSSHTRSGEPSRCHSMWGGGPASTGHSRVSCPPGTAVMLGVSPVPVVLRGAAGWVTVGQGWQVGWAPPCLSPSIPNWP